MVNIWCWICTPAMDPKISEVFGGFSSHSYGDVTITGEGLQILTNARQSWPLSSEGSLECHNFFDTGVISEADQKP